MVPPVEFDIVEEVKEEKAPLMVRLVEDFSLQSESEDDEDEEVVEIMTKIITTAQPPADIISPMSTEDSLEVKKEVAEEEKEVAVFNKEEKEVVVSNEEELLMDVKSKVDFLEKAKQQITRLVLLGGSTNVE